MGAAVHGDPLSGQTPADGLEASLGHRFDDPALLAQALTHRSAASGGLGSNERLEFVGDRVLGLVMAEWLFERFPGEPEGALGIRQARLVSRDALAPIADAIGLGNALRLSPDAARAGVAGLANARADAMEAVLGAMFLDGGLAPVRGFVRRAWADAMEAQASARRDPKTALQEALAASGLPPPAYRVVRETGPSHAPRFEIEVEAFGETGRAEGGSKREAEREAASLLLARLPRRRRRRS